MNSNNEQQDTVVIIGGGLAGLACARRLSERGRPCMILEATDRVGGRVRTDHVDGFTLDHGFQVLLTAYPACRELLDYQALDLCPFEPGALIRQRGAFRVLSDPWRRPFKTLATAANPVGTFWDKLRIASLRRASRQGELNDLYERESVPAIERLRGDGFSEKMIDEFFRPFLGGVFLDETLSTSSRMVEFVFRMFAEGDIAIPAGGMAEIPRQLADGLPRGTVRFGAAVDRIETDVEGENRVVLSDGEMIRCRDLVVATPSSTAARLLGSDAVSTSWLGTTNIYFAAEQSPDRQKLLMLRGDESGPIQTAVVLSDVAPQYAPTGKSLISVSVDSKDESPAGLDEQPMLQQVRSQLVRWFGNEANQWEKLRTYRVPYALPEITMDNVLNTAKLCVGSGLYLAGDHCESPSIQGAMNSGLRVAERLILDGQ